MGQRTSRRIAIVGSGFSGMALGIQLERAGIDSFTIFEKGDSLGGTWRDNTYPGAACDIPSVAYSFSFEPKADWSHKWSPQAEILEYMEHCAQKYGILPHIRFGTAIECARYDEASAHWILETSTGERVEADVLVSGVGQLHRPNLPEFEGIDTFGGEIFHSARWNHAVPVEGRNVIVVGNAASAVQFVPEIAPRVKRLTILQRSANWMIPRGDRAFSEREKNLFARHPLLLKLYRWFVWLRFEVLFFPVMKRASFLGRRIAAAAEKQIREVVDDTKLHDRLIPDYPVGAKRILVADGYYETLNLDSVELVTQPIDHFEVGGVVTADGAHYPGDVVILATGFDSNSFLAPMRIEGRSGCALEERWENGAEAYLGMAVPDFPNFFMMYGPNTNLGHNSIIFMIECQARYVLDCIRRIEEEDLAWIDVRPEVMSAFNAEIQSRLERSVWAAPGKSWYKLESGRITNNWAGTTFEYWWRTRRPDVRAWRSLPRAVMERRAEPTDPNLEMASPREDVA